MPSSGMNESRRKTVSQADEERIAMARNRSTDAETGAGDAATETGAGDAAATDLPPGSVVIPGAATVPTDAPHAVPIVGTPTTRPLQSLAGEGEQNLYSRPFGSEPGTYDPATGQRFPAPDIAARTDVHGADTFPDTDAGSSARSRMARATDDQKQAEADKANTEAA
jgi:hypothetical protein